VYDFAPFMIIFTAYEELRPIYEGAYALERYGEEYFSSSTNGSVIFELILHHVTRLCSFYED
jgi:hypothetical protein